MTSSFSLTKHIKGEKPHSSITEWVEILSSDRYSENTYDGIPELVESINLQAEGPTEASRAIRKKIKYGNRHRQLRALTILNALVENGGQKFQRSFADPALVTRLKAMGTDHLTDERMRRKLMNILKGWHIQFKDDPKMATVAGLWEACGGASKTRPPQKVDVQSLIETEGATPKARDAKKARDEADRRAKEERRKQKEALKAKEKEKHKKPAPITQRPKRSFDFEKEKPQIINSVAEASQVAIQLSNALMLVNREKEKIEDNEQVQECLTKAKATRKTIVRYVQLVENEELIGTLIDANERIIQALELYDKLLKSAADGHDSDEEATAAQLQQLSLGQSPSVENGEISKLQGKQRMRIQRSISRSSLNVNSGGVSHSPTAASAHPDLKDLTWGGSLDQETHGALPPPIQPQAADDPYASGRNHGSLSDYSDYDSDEDSLSEEERQRRGHSIDTSATSAYDPLSPRASKPREYEGVMPTTAEDRESIASGSEAKKGLLQEEDADPFADPFADGDGASLNDYPTMATTAQNQK